MNLLAIRSDTKDGQQLLAICLLNRQESDFLIELKKKNDKKRK